MWSCSAVMFFAVWEIFISRTLFSAMPCCVIRTLLNGINKYCSKFVSDSKRSYPGRSWILPRYERDRQNNYKGLVCRLFLIFQGPDGKLTRRNKRFPAEGSSLTRGREKESHFSHWTTHSTEMRKSLPRRMSYRSEKFPLTKNIKTKLSLQLFSVELCSRPVRFDFQNVLHCKVLVDRV